MGVWSCQGLYGGVVMSRTVWGCGHVKDCMGVCSCQGLYGGVVMSRTVWGCGHVKDCMGVWSCQGLIEMSMVSTWPWTVPSLCSKRTLFRDSYRRGGALGYPPPNIGSPPPKLQKKFLKLVAISIWSFVYHLKYLKKATLQLLPTPPCPLSPPLSGKSCMNPCYYRYDLEFYISL